MRFLFPLMQGTPVAPQLPDVEWFSNYGPLGVIFLVLIGGFVAYLYFVDLPRRKDKALLEAKSEQQRLEHLTETQRQDREFVAARQEIELERERKGLILFDTLRAGFAADQSYKQEQAKTNAVQTQLLKTVVEVQKQHAAECGRTSHDIRILAERSTRPMTCQSADCHNSLEDSYHYKDKIYLCDECIVEQMHVSGLENRTRK
jgi:hypothetical protein